MNVYSTKAAFAEKHLPKLIEWIQKGRYKLIEHAMEDHITLKVDIFTFVLKLRNLSEEETATGLLEELQKVRAERQKILKEVKLFNYYFFNVFNEGDFKGRSSHLLPKVPAHQIEKYIESPESLFVVKEAIAVSPIMLRFSEDMCFDESPQRFPGPYLDKFVIDGPGYSFQMCPLSKREAIVERPCQIFVDKDSEALNEEDSDVSQSATGYKY